MGEWYSCLIRWSSSPCSERCSFGAIWDKEEKTLTSPATHSECHCTDGSDRNVSNPAGKLFERCAGKDLRVQLNGYAVTLSGWKITKIPDKPPGFFRTQLKYSECKEGLFMQEIFFEVQGLTEWVYFESWASFCVDLGNRSEAFSEWLKDNKKSWLAFLRAGERSLFYVKAWDTSPEKFHFKYLDENFTLTLYDKCIKGWDARFRFSYERKCYFGITSSREHDKEFFETLIRKITYFLTLLFGKEAVANRIWESDKQQWGWNYNPSEKESSADDHPYPCISYDTIRDKFKEKLTAWLSKYECYGTIIDCFFRDSPKVLPEPKTNNISEEEKRNIFETFFRRLQLLEMYGNVSTKGENTMNSLRGAVEAVHKKVWGDIIRDIGDRIPDFRISQDGTSWELYPYSFGNTPEHQKEDFVRIVMAFRNYFVHPYRDGKKKTPFYRRDCKIFHHGRMRLVGKS